jgi:hypothetical protein
MRSMSHLAPMWLEYALRVSSEERFAILMAPMCAPPVAEEWCAVIPLDVQRLRFREHERTITIVNALRAKGAGEPEAFVGAMKLAAFELRHRLVVSWPGFALLFVKLLGVEYAPLFPSLFLAALGQPGVPKPDFDLDEVMGFQAHIAPPPCLPPSLTGAQGVLLGPDSGAGFGFDAGFFGGGEAQLLQA